MFQLRPYRSSDLAELHQLDQVCFPRDIAYSRAELRYFLNHPHCSCWVAELPSPKPGLKLIRSKLAGFIIVERQSSEGQPNGHIITLDVDPAHRRRGLGTLLMRTAEERFRQEGTVTFSLEVAETNIAARDFYRGLGFEPRGRIEKYYGGKLDAEVMEKRL
jgi:[ribosomal protein S18]-alanine N-acetyltransferase